MIPLVLWMLGCDGDDAGGSGAPKGVLVYSGNVDGDIEPCG